MIKLVVPPKHWHNVSWNFKKKNKENINPYRCHLKTIAGTHLVVDDIVVLKEYKEIESFDILNTISTPKYISFWNKQENY